MTAARLHCAPDSVLYHSPVAEAFTHQVQNLTIPHLGLRVLSVPRGKAGWLPDSRS